MGPEDRRGSGQSTDFQLEGLALCTLQVGLDQGQDLGFLESGHEDFAGSVVRDLARPGRQDVGTSSAITLRFN